MSDGAKLACSNNEHPVVTPSQTSMISIDHQLLGNYSRAPTTADTSRLGFGDSDNPSRTQSGQSSLYRQSTPFSVRIERLHAKLLKLGKPTSDATPTQDPRDLPCLPLPRMVSGITHDYSDKNDDYRNVVFLIFSFIFVAPFG